MGRAKVSPFEQPMRKSIANGLICTTTTTAPPPPPPPLQPRPSPRMRTCSSYHEGIVLPYELPAVSIWSYISSIDFVLTNHAHYNSSRTRRAGCCRRCRTRRRRSPSVSYRRRTSKLGLKRGNAIEVQM